MSQTTEISPGEVYPHARVILGCHRAEHVHGSLCACAACIKTALREVRIATLVEAARLCCVDCGAGKDVRFEVETFFRAVVLHEWDECRAEPIILKLVEEWA